MAPVASTPIFYPVMIVNPDAMDCNSWKSANTGATFAAHPCMPTMVPVACSLQYLMPMKEPVAPRPAAVFTDTGGPPGTFTAFPCVRACGSQQASEKQLEEALSPRRMLGRVWKLARDPEGCRALQEAFEDCDSDDTRAALAWELRTHVWEALKSPNANHVIQKCISTIRPLDLQFIVDELMQAGSGAVCKAARHRYGCRVLQRLLEHCLPEQKNRLAEQLLTEAVTLSTHLFGNYVMQHLLEHGSDAHISSLTQVLTANASVVCRDPHGSAVLEKCFAHASPTAQAALANALVMDPEQLAVMGCSRHGNRAAKEALVAAEQQFRDLAMTALVSQRDKLRASRYGRVLATFAEKYLQSETVDSSSLDDDDE